jgi:hypothetical protein
VSLRETVTDLYVFAHKIRRALAEEHVAAMDAVELMDRLHMYARNGVAARMNQSTEMESSVAGPKTERGSVSSTRFSRPATMTAGLRRSTLFPSSRPSKRSGKPLPDSEVKNLVRSQRRALARR